MMYYVAPSYENYKKIGQPFRNTAGKLVTKAKCKCPRCGGLGFIAARVENNQPIPIPVDQGICYQCLGQKYIEKVIRLYTKSEYDAMKRNNERAKQKREANQEARRLAEFEQKKAKWLSDNGFNAEGGTYLYIGEDSYQIKDDLKTAGFRYNPILKWHGPAPADYEKVEFHKVEEFYELTAWGTYSILSTAEAKMKEITDASRPKSTSKWIGTVGEKIKDLPVTLVSIRGFVGKWGYSQVVTFKDAEDDILTWFTTVEIKIKEGETCHISGTIKKLDEYKGEKHTVLSRCRIA